MSYWILPKIGIPVLRTMVQRVTYLETCIDARKQRFKVYGKDINERFHNKYTEEASAGPNITKPTMEMWSELAEYDEDFQSEFKKVFYNPAVKEADKELSHDSYDNYVNVELKSDRGGDRTEFARAKKRLK